MKVFPTIYGSRRLESRLSTVAGGWKAAYPWYKAAAGKPPLHRGSVGDFEQEVVLFAFLHQDIAVVEQERFGGGGVGVGNLLFVD